MGGPRSASLELSNQTRLNPLTSENVNAGQYTYFICKPVGDWKIDADFLKDDLAKLMIYQSEQKFQIAWKGDIVVEGAVTSILIGFPKTVKLNQLFLFQYPLGTGMSQAEVKVPQDLWPGFALLNQLNKQAEDASNAKQFKTAIGTYEMILSNPDLQIFPLYSDVKSNRTKVFDGFYTDTWTSFQGVVGNAQMELKEKIGQIDRFKPMFQFFIDSLPRAVWGVGALDVAVSPILDKARSTLGEIQTMRDSLQRGLDTKNTSWIIGGGATGKDGFKYQYMIETLAYAFSSMDFSDTSVTQLKLRVPEVQVARLAKYSISESYDTFIRICADRFQSRLPIFPIDFLPNLRKDTAFFPLPYYSMLKAVNDYYYGTLSSAKDEVFKVFRTCYEPELNYRFDQLRVMIMIREQKIPVEITKMLQEAEQLDDKKDVDGALEKYRQANIIAPNFAYGFYGLARHFVRVNEAIRAINFFQRAYQLDTLYLTAYRDAFSLYLKQSTYKPMIEVMTTALQHGNDYWEINMNLGQAYLGESDPARAIQSFERALSLNPRSYKTNIQLGLAHQAVKDYQKAREYFNNAINLDPNRQDAVDFQAKLNELMRQGK